MEEFQLRLRAQKEEERQKKTETTKNLHQYRGGVAEEGLKLKALRDEDRKKQQDAERLLRSFRGSPMRPSETTPTRKSLEVEDQADPHESQTATTATSSSSSPPRKVSFAEDQPATTPGGGSSSPPRIKMYTFTGDIPEKERVKLQATLETFVGEHAAHHRPIAVVSSGGTACDLEINSVRCLDNFSTGLRGALSVEEFLKRGYAVIHLWRKGSASPFARAVNEQIGLAQANHAIDVDSLGQLFSIHGDDTEDDEDAIVKSVLREQAENDPFLTEPNTSWHAATNGTSIHRDDEVMLRRSIVNSSRIHRALRERAVAMKENRLLTIPFRTVDEYLARLQMSAEALRDCQSLAIFFLAAAVSDFYIPKEERSEHKIQSDGREEDGLVLRLKPVPKTLGLLRSIWAPDAFVVSFKLETDKDILRQKAERAVDRYGCHLVIGNLLQSRHEKVWILSPDNQRNKIPVDANEWSMFEITKARSSDQDSLESSILDFVVQSHFEFISWHFRTDGSGVLAAERAQRALQERKRQAQLDRLKEKIVSVGAEVLGAVVAVALSYTINVALQRRLRGD